MTEEQVNGRQDEELDDEDKNDSDETIVMSTDDDDNDNVGDLSVELNVEELVAKLEATDDDNVARQREIKRRLEQMNQQREDESSLDSTYNFNMDDDI